MVFDSNEKCSLTQYHAKLTHYLPKTPLAKCNKKPYIKKEPRNLLVTGTGAGAARYSAPHGCR